MRWQSFFFLRSSAFPDTSGYCPDRVSCWDRLRIYDIHEIRWSVCHEKVLRSLSWDYWRGTGTQTLRAFLIACQKLPKSSKHLMEKPSREHRRFKHQLRKKSWQHHGKHENMQGAQCHGMHLLCIGTASLLGHSLFRILRTFRTIMSTLLGNLQRCLILELEAESHHMSLKVMQLPRHEEVNGRNEHASTKAGCSRMLVHTEPSFYAEKIHVLLAH